MREFAGVPAGRATRIQRRCAISRILFGSSANRGRRRSAGRCDAFGAVMRSGARGFGVPFWRWGGLGVIGARHTGIIGSFARWRAKDIGCRAGRSGRPADRA